MIFVLLLGPHAHDDVETGIEHHGSFFETLFHAAGVWAPLTLGVLAIGIVANFVLFYRNFNRAVNGVALAQQLKKLVDADNIDRALKLCRAAEGAVATQVARAGLEARMQKQDSYAAMDAARTRIIDALRKGHVITLGLGVAALIESGVMIAAAVSKGFPGNEIGAIAVLPAVLACVMLVNVMRWNGMQRDLDVVIDALR